MKLIKTLSAFLFFSSRAQVEFKSVQCLAGSPGGTDADPCSHMDRPCPARAGSHMNVTVGDYYDLTIDHGADPQESLCGNTNSGPDGPGCEAFSFDLLIMIVEGDVSSDVDLELSKKGLHGVCYSDCLTDTVENSGVFSGICQFPRDAVGTTGSCTYPGELDTFPPTLDDRLCAVPLKMATGTLTCIKGPCLGLTTTAPATTAEKTTTPTTVPTTVGETSILTRRDYSGAAAMLSFLGLAAFVFA